MNRLFHPAVFVPALCMAFAGMLIYLVLVSRRLLVIRDSRLKLPLLLVVFAVLVLGGFALAFALSPIWRLSLSLAVFAGILAGEWRRLRIRRRCAGSPPIDTVFHDVPLLRPETTTDLVCHRYEIALPEWKGPPFRIVHLTDFHVNPKFDEDYYRSALDRAEALEPDYVFFTGDYVTLTASVPILERVIRKIGKRDNFAVLGNHDHWTDPKRIRAVLEKAGLRMLVQDNAIVDLGGHPIHVIGCDYWGYTDIRIPTFPEGPGLKLVLCHTPDAIYTLARMGAHAVFSGHNHAGQARVPWLGPVIVPSRFGRRFDHGHFVVEGAHLFVSSGIGAASPPRRFYCQPDIFVVDVSGAALRESPEG
jgi:predicted MPP superfamily phosphohydrolase